MCPTKLLFQRNELRQDAGAHLATKLRIQHHVVAYRANQFRLSKQDAVLDVSVETGSRKISRRYDGRGIIDYEDFRMKA